MLVKAVNHVSAAAPSSHVMLLAAQMHSGKVLCACQVPKVTSRPVTSLTQVAASYWLCLCPQVGPALPASAWALALCGRLGGNAGGSSLVAKGTGSSRDIRAALEWAELVVQRAKRGL